MNCINYELEFVAGNYERIIKLSPPPITMIVFSLFQLAAYLIDDMYFQKYV